jgi:hypothetical protein
MIQSGQKKICAFPSQGLCGDMTKIAGRLGHQDRFSLKIALHTLLPIRFVVASVTFADVDSRQLEQGLNLLIASLEKIGAAID